MFCQGQLEQVGAPHEIYERPATSFVAGFVGTSNLLDDASSRRLLGTGGAHSIRPERIQIITGAGDAGARDVVASGTVSDIQYLGADSRVHVQLDGGVGLAVTVSSERARDIDVGATLTLSWTHAAAQPVVYDDPFSAYEAPSITNNPTTGRRPEEETT